ncbi:hypothetical protein [Winogradskyella ursingii]|uniref:hypothetical protein n=1 Tax=Winogradskyella ursingii TaxID=2686079 RepID=UPI0015CBCC65|nr:hypothetical protein [Winogradskyella ursingii]
MKKLLIVFIIFIGICKLNSQESINNYKYVVVPLQFDFQKGQNQYRLNTLIKQLFEQAGFEVYYDNKNLPKDLFDNRCLALYADVKEAEGAFLYTKVEILLNDCNDNLIMKSREGLSKEKQFKDAYKIAAREAFKTLKLSGYSYQPDKINSNEQVEVVEQPVGIEAESKKKLTSDKTSKEEITSVTPNKTQENDSDLNQKPTYYAQKINMGYQVVDATPKIIMVLLSTDAEHIFIVKNKNAVVYKEDGFWIYSENDGAKQKTEFIVIKF